MYRAIANDSFDYTYGYVLTDIDGNNFVDANDVAIADNNAFNFVSKMKP